MSLVERQSIPRSLRTGARRIDILIEIELGKSLSESGWLTIKRKGVFARTHSISVDLLDCNSTQARRMELREVREFCNKPQAYTRA